MFSISSISLHDTMPEALIVGQTKEEKSGLSR